MVAVRSSHFNKDSKLDSQEWIINLGISNHQSCKRLIETWNYFLKTTKKLPNAELLFWRSVEMVEILSMLDMDVDTLCSALLLPLINANVAIKEMLYESVNVTVLALIRGVCDMTAASCLNSIHIDDVFSERVDKNVYRLLLTMVSDFRCLVIKLAERMTYLREIRSTPKEERILVAKECTSIYVPLANRLGIWQLKWELEDYCFRYLHPTEYTFIAKLLHERRIDREYYIEKFVINLRKSMKEKNVKAEIYGRPKHIYSIWRKMQKKNLSFNEIFDIRAVRIIAESLQECYIALRILHTNFCYLPDEFDDYIVNPKPNGYQSIHTVILGPDQKTIEIQIRTKQMHKNAELGVAAHWKYKEGNFSTHFWYKNHITSHVS